MDNRNTVQNLVAIDDIYFNVRIPKDGIKRSFSVADTENAGRKLDGTMERDIIGTYYNYTIQFDTKYMSYQEYDDFYNKISYPEEYHKITVPFGQGTITFNAYITTGSDTLSMVQESNNKWKGLSINFVAMSPFHKPQGAV